MSSPNHRTLLLLRFPEFDREAMRMKFKLHDIRDSKVWKEAVEEGREEGREEGDALRLRKTVETLLAKRKSLKEIGELLDISVDQLRALMNNHSD